MLYKLKDIELFDKTEIKKREIKFTIYMFLWIKLTYLYEMIL